MLREEIVKIAKDYLGKQEIKNNQGFFDKKFEKDMKSVGFVKGQAWCAYFAELIWKFAFRTHYGATLSYIQDLLDKSFSANAVQTYNRFGANGFLLSTIPLPGDLVVWISYKNGKPNEIVPKYFAGHIGIVSEVLGENKFKSIEGNTNSNGGREGIEVAEKTRTFTWTSENGLRLLGFVKPFKG